MSATPENPDETALVQISPEMALVFGEVPDGTDLVPFSLISHDEQSALVDAVAATSSVLHVGGQIAEGLTRTRGLVRLAPETLEAMRAGATPLQSAGYNLGALRDGSQITAQVRWLPATDVTTVGMAASLGPAFTMVAIQAQLKQVSDLAEQNLQLTETVLRSVRQEEWSELSGLDQAVSGAFDEARAVGQVTPLLWANIEGHDAALRKQRDLFRGHLQTHARELTARDGHRERRDYLEKHGEAVLLDLHSLLIAHKTWFEYQALRAGRVKLDAAESPQDQKLLETIVDKARREYDDTVTQMRAVLDTFTRELGILAELPGRRTLPFTGSRRSADEVGRMARQMLDAVERLAESARQPSTPLERPGTCYVGDDEQLAHDLRILRWHVDRDEHPAAIAIGHDADAGGPLTALARAQVLIVVTDRRVLTADPTTFRKHGDIAQSVPNDDIRYVRHHEDDGSGRARIDLITKDGDLSWTFGKDSASATEVRELAALLGDRMGIPEAEQNALRAALPAPAEQPETQNS